MYMTFVAGSPCAKTVSFARNLFTFLPRPAESRNSCTSNAGLLRFAWGEERRAFSSTRLAAEDTMVQNSMKHANCPVGDSPFIVSTSRCPVLLAHDVSGPSIFSSFHRCHGGERKSRGG